MSVSVVFLRAVCASLEPLGIQEARLLHAAGLPEDALNDVSALVCRRDADALCAAALSLSRQPGLGLLVGLTSSEASLHLLGHLLMACASLREAAAALGELGPSLIGEPAPSLVEGPHGARLVLPSVDVSAAARFQAEVLMSILYKLVLRYAEGVRELLPRVEFAHLAPRYASDYARTFPCALAFEQPAHAVVFASELLDRRLAGRDPAVAASLRQLIHEQFIAPRRESSWTSRVRRALREASDLAHLDFDDLAYRWGVTHRTLRRRVQGEGHTLSDLLDQARFERASARLERPEESIKEVAERLGYAETSSFHRAFKRWAGVTPNAFRKRSGAGAAFQ
jgi:AraC-like DNA-binding protein